MKASVDEGWDEDVLVWNATVARIPAPAAQQDPPGDAAAVEGGGAEPGSRSERQSNTRKDWRRTGVCK
jgi:hypothetical protein